MKRHRWIAMMAYDLTPQDALRMVGLLPMKGAELPITALAADEAPAAGDERPYFGTHNLARDLCSVGCYDCEAALTDVRQAEAECPGQPPGELTYVDADGRITDHRERVGHQDVPCPCGSRKKYKRCHGAT